MHRLVRPQTMTYMEMVSIGHYLTTVPIGVTIVCMCGTTSLARGNAHLSQ